MEAERFPGVLIVEEDADTRNWTALFLKLWSSPEAQQKSRRRVFLDSSLHLIRQGTLR
jgi:hypothetical protein